MNFCITLLLNIIKTSWGATSLRWTPMFLVSNGIYLATIIIILSRTFLIVDSLTLVLARVREVCKHWIFFMWLPEWFYALGLKTRLLRVIDARQSRKTDKTISKIFEQYRSIVRDVVLKQRKKWAAANLSQPWKDLPLPNFSPFQDYVLKQSMLFQSFRNLLSVFLDWWALITGSPVIDLGQSCPKKYLIYFDWLFNERLENFMNLNNLLL